MSLQEKIDSDYKQAMKDRDSAKSSTLSFLRAQLKNLMIDERLEKCEDSHVIAVIKKQVKQRQDSIEQFEKGGRTDLADKEKAELELLEEYLPEQMGEAELKPLIDAAISEAGASGMKDMGAVMKAVTARVAGCADNKMVSTLVREALSKL